MSSFDVAIVTWNDYVTTPEGEFELGERTVTQYYSIINNFSKGIEKLPEEISAEDIDIYIKSLRKAKLKSSTINKYVSALKSFFFILHSIGMIEVDPTADIRLSFRRGKRKRRVEEKTLTKDEIQLLFQTLEEWRFKNGKKDPNQERDRLIIQLLYATGMRRSELSSKRAKWGIMVKNIDLERGVIVVRRKGGFDQEVVITDLVPDVREKLRDWLTKKDLKGNEKLFTIGDRWVNFICRKWGQRAGFTKKLTSHRLRHTFGSHLGDLGVPAQTIQDLMDHSSITTTDQYVSTTKEAAMNILSGFGLYSPLREEKENGTKNET